MEETFIPTENRERADDLETELASLAYDLRKDGEGARRSVQYALITSALGIMAELRVLADAVAFERE